MKSFQAKMYIEDGMATTEFDIHVLGTDGLEELEPNYAFMVRTVYPTPEEREKYSMSEKNQVLIGIYNLDTMLQSGEMLSEMNDEPVSAIKEETIKFLELYIEGKECVKQNFIFPPGVERTVLNDKRIRNGDKWDVVGTNPDTGEETQKRTYPISTENEAEIIAEVKQLLEAVRNNEKPREYPDGTPWPEWELGKDEEGNEAVRPKKED